MRRRRERGEGEGGRGAGACVSYCHGTASPSRQTLMPCCEQQASFTSSTHDSSCTPSLPPPSAGGAAHDCEALAVRAAVCWQGDMKSDIACTSKMKKPAPIICIVAAQSSQKGTSSSAHAGEQRAGKPSLQSAADMDPQQIGAMPSISRSIPRLHPCARPNSPTPRRRAVVVLVVMLPINPEVRSEAIARVRW